MSYFLKCLLFIFLITECNLLYSQKLDNTINQNTNSFKLLSLEKDTVFFSFKKDYTIFCAFSVYCSSCINELNMMEQNLKKWDSLYSINIIGFVNASDNSDFQKIVRFSKKHNYTFPLYIDIKGELVTFLMSLENVKKDGNFRIFGSLYECMRPQLFVFDKSGNLIFQKRGFVNGDELIIQDVFIKNR